MFLFDRPLATGIILCILPFVAVMFLCGRPFATGIILCILPLVAVVFLFGGRPRGPHPAVVGNPTGCLSFDGGCRTYSYCLRPTDEIIFARFWRVQGAALVAVRLLLEYFLFGRPLATVMILCILPFVAVMFYLADGP